MAADHGSNGDSGRVSGGSIPGAHGTPAFTLAAPEPSAVPVLIAVPHGGRAYPGQVLERMRHPGYAALRLEDRYADRLGEAMARATGAALLVAQAPRAMIDLNRAVEDVDWDMFAGRGMRSLGSYAPGSRARSGLGLIPRRLPGLGELWKRRHEEADLAARIEQIHSPYHECLSATLLRLRERWGAALLIDLHSMPPLGWRSGQAPPEFVLGDRFGAACHGMLMASCFAFMAEARRLAAHNRPYAGGYVLERHADPARGIHALQLEIDRTSYLDARMAEPGEGFEPMVQLLSALVRRLAGEVADLGRGGNAAPWAIAAE
jgi:N-formylglutamate amidohydrolase